MQIPHIIERKKKKKTLRVDRPGSATLCNSAQYCIKTNRFVQVWRCDSAKGCGH